MKKTILFALLITLVSGVNAQVETVKSAESAVPSKRVKKEVRMEENNGVKKLTIVTDVDGKVTEEVYEGAAADEKLSELQNENPNIEEKGETVEVKMTEVNGKKHLEVIKRKDGKESVTVYEGEEAEKQLKLIEAEQTPPKKQKVIIKEEKKIEKSDM